MNFNLCWRDDFYRHDPCIIKTRPVLTTAESLEERIHCNGPLDFLGDIVDTVFGGGPEDTVTKTQQEPWGESRELLRNFALRNVPERERRNIRLPNITHLSQIVDPAKPNVLPGFLDNDRGISKAFGTIMDRAADPQRGAEIGNQIYESGGNTDALRRFSPEGPQSPFAGGGGLDMLNRSGNAGPNPFGGGGGAGMVGGAGNAGPNPFAGGGGAGMVGGAGNAGPNPFAGGGGLKTMQNVAGGRSPFRGGGNNPFSGLSGAPGEQSGLESGLSGIRGYGVGMGAGQQQGGGVTDFKSAMNAANNMSVDDAIGKLGMGGKYTGKDQHGLLRLAAAIKGTPMDKGASLGGNLNAMQRGTGSMFDRFQKGGGQDFAMSNAAGGGQIGRVAGTGMGGPIARAQIGMNRLDPSGPPGVTGRTAAGGGPGATVRDIAQDTSRSVAPLNQGLYDAGLDRSKQLFDQGGRSATLDSIANQQTDNPYLMKTLDRAAEATRSSVGGAMSAAGRYGGGYHGRALGDAIGDIYNKGLSSAYENTQNRRLDAAKSAMMGRTGAQTGALGNMANMLGALNQARGVDLAAGDSVANRRLDAGKTLLNTEMNAWNAAANRQADAYRSDQDRAARLGTSMAGLEQTGRQADLNRQLAAGKQLGDWEQTGRQADLNRQLAAGKQLGDWEQTGRQADLNRMVNVGTQLTNLQHRGHEGMMDRALRGATAGADLDLRAQLGGGALVNDAGRVADLVGRTGLATALSERGIDQSALDREEGWINRDRQKYVDAAERHIGGVLSVAGVGGTGRSRQVYDPSRGIFGQLGAAKAIFDLF